VSREADNGPLSEDLSASRHRDIVLADVYTVRRDVSGQFGRVVDDEGHAKVVTDGFHDQRGRSLGVEVTGLFSQLHHVDAASKDSGQELLEVIANPDAEIETARTEVKHTAHPRSWGRAATFDGPVRQNGGMQIPAKAEYAIRALLTLAASDVSVSADHLAHEQDLPAKFLGAILSDLRRGGLVTSQRGPEGGFKLARDPDTIMIADILRVVSGPMAGVRGMRPETLIYEGEAKHLRDVWVAVRGTLREVLEHVTLGQVLRGDLPPAVTRFTEDPDAWITRVI
jgi:Rrf2 family protein